MDLANIQSVLAAAWASDLRVLAVYLHGSQVKGTARMDSDVDCALLLYPGQAMSSLERMRLAGVLGSQLGVTLDLGLLSFSNLVYFSQVLFSGRRIYCRDEALADSLVSRVYSLYARFREDRREVEDAYAATR